eukprot:TRINITY_DN6070_c0_g1_i1.p1 TRINITY_DN6070_c0_g1~~TRINITY_DN6070_c0_g1_i1.p1  ORF type:complete len:122 (-),score=17.17 TRINITY_DN6070_c0_g1_i1:18-383(-)
MERNFIRRELSFKMIQFSNPLWIPFGVALGYKQIQIVERSTEGVVGGFPWIFVDKNSQEIYHQLKQKLKAEDPTADTRMIGVAVRQKGQVCNLVLEPLTWGYRFVDVELVPQTSNFSYPMK